MKPSDMKPSELAQAIGAGTEPQRIHQSFWVEASNYLNHHKVRDRPAEQQRKIVKGLRDLSLRLPNDSGGGDVRTIAYALCTEADRDCEDVARIIEASASTDELEAVLRNNLRQQAQRMARLDETFEMRITGADTALPEETY
ncbi:MAG: hypothetical protein AAF481_15205 [Acidobacteriota bacterium]